MMREFVFSANLSDDEPIIRTLDGLSHHEREDFIRKALHAFIKQNAPATSKSKERAYTVRPEPHGYPVE